MSAAEETIRAFENRSAVIGVLGLGYAGLPLACMFAEAGFSTVGFEVNRNKVEQLNRGDSYIGHLPADRIKQLVKNNALRATCDFESLQRCDAVIICVPTPLAGDGTPDLSLVRNAAELLARHLHRAQLIVLESTTYPGTTDELVLDILTTSGLKVGVDFFLAFSPEREDPANSDFVARTIPKVVGGVTVDCLTVATSAYRQIFERVVPVSSARVAEAAKLLENIYRCVNVAMINELKVMFERMDIDVWEVISAASTKPFGFSPFYPGPGVGGHCIPIDPVYLTWKARQHDFALRLIEIACEINRSMPAHVVDRLTEGLNLQGKPLRDANILLVGVTYKRDIEDIRESPALEIIRILESRLAHTSYHDPRVPRLRMGESNRELLSSDLTEGSVTATDAVVIVTDHRDVDYELILKHAKLVVDTRNVTAGLRKRGDNVITA